jgi:hypothetical protein
MPTVTSVTKHFPVAKEGFVTTLSSSITSGAAIVPLNSVTGYSNGDVAVLVVEPSNTTNKQVVTGTVDTAGVRLTGAVWTEGTNVGHSSGSTVADYVAATHMAMLTKGLLVVHNQDGTIKPAIIYDSSGNEEVRFTATAVAVNDLTVRNAATGNAPAVLASGDDTNVSINFVPKGTGEIQWNGVGVSGAFTTWSPTYANFTPGNATITARYKQQGKLITFYVDCGCG